MAVSIWQTGHLNVNDHTAFPLEFLQPCAREGYAVVQTMLNPEHPSTALDQVPLWYLKQVRSCSLKNFGFVWADDFQSPESLFNFCLAWRKQSLEAGCAITGFVINCEDGWEAHDQAGDRWSERFLVLFRGHPLTQKLNLALNTYVGCGGIALYLWMKANARLYCQTFHESNTHEWPMDMYVPWARGYGYAKPAQIKANLGTYKPFPSRMEQINAMKRAGVTGYSAWYGEGAGDPAEVLIPLLREAVRAGVAYFRP